ncbi:hypothetical protein FHETE_4563 [Fusarium heterosporum]|uniref:Myb-like domain-containing protein n=1 Tax=Fusarium heterosporum TaxID=42747 RepID=A0A8H5TIW3_FUSHE|nr:hypothetical protein FHETE_4563 [Fusarium heterosporum]
MNSKNWNDRADKDLFFTILSVKNIGVISGSEWTTIGNHMRSLGYGFTNEGCRQHFQGLRRAQNKTETSGPNGEPVRRHDPTMNPITRRPGPGRGRPRKQPPVPMTGDPGEAVPSSPLAPGQVPEPPNSAPPFPHPHPHPHLHPQAASSYAIPSGTHQPVPAIPDQDVGRPANISPAPPAQQVPTPNDTVSTQAHVTYPSPPVTTDLPQSSAQIHPLQNEQLGQPDQQTRPEQQIQPEQQPQPNYTPEPAQQAQPEQQSEPITQHQPVHEGHLEYQSPDLQHEPLREIREATDASATSQPPPIEQNNEAHASIASEPLQQVSEDIDADGDAEGDDEGDAEADIHDDEPSAKRPRLSSPEPSKDGNMDDEAVLALAAHNGASDFASEICLTVRLPLSNLAPSLLNNIITSPSGSTSTLATPRLLYQTTQQLIIMPGKSSDWDNAEFLMDLTVALYTGAQVNKGLTPAIKESIEEYLKTRGYSTSFDAIRALTAYFPSSIAPSFQSYLHLNLISPLTQPHRIITPTLPLRSLSFSCPSTSIVHLRIMAKRQVMVWDSNVHEDILICLFQHIKPTSEDWSNVMRDLQEKGYTFTEGALRYGPLHCFVLRLLPA